MQQSKSKEIEDKNIDISENPNESNLSNNQDKRIPRWSELKDRYLDAVYKNLLTGKFIVNFLVLGTIFFILPLSNVVFMILAPIIGCLYMLTGKKINTISSNFVAIHLSVISATIYRLFLDSAVASSSFNFIFSVLFIFIVSFSLYVYYVMGKDLV
jgi:uncharacterized metal-binding protein